MPNVRCTHCGARGVPVEHHDIPGGRTRFVGCLICGRGEYKTPAPVAGGGHYYAKEPPLEPILRGEDFPKKRGRPPKHRPALTR